MKQLLPILLASLVGGGSMSLSACALGCGATEQKLASLRPGMTYDETTQIMGCPGSLTTGHSPNKVDYAIVEWDGPKDPFFTRTRLHFQDAKLLSYVIEKRGAL